MAFSITSPLLNQSHLDEIIRSEAQLATTYKCLEGDPDYQQHSHRLCSALLDLCLCRLASTRSSPLHVLVPQSALDLIH
jgi:hypothetical protein